VKTGKTAPTPDRTGKQPLWVKTPVANLVRYRPSGVYFARVRIRGKLFRQTLKTVVMSVAKLRLANFIKERQEAMGEVAAVQHGKLPKLLAAVLCVSVNC
jgi:hypothetical protein